VLELNQHLTTRLTESGWKILSPLRDEQTRSGETLVEVENPAAVTRALHRHGVIVTEKPQGIRVATHFFNDEEDIEKLMQALAG
jgi:selenocysteine lyase/cysteine desulfurase